MAVLYVLGVGMTAVNVPGPVMEVVGMVVGLGLLAIAMVAFAYYVIGW